MRTVRTHGGTDKWAGSSFELPASRKPIVVKGQASLSEVAPRKSLMHAIEFSTMEFRKMTDGPKVYIETSVVFHLTAAATTELFGEERRVATTEWWENQRPHFELYTSALTLEEAAGGDPEDAALQLEALAGIPALEITDGVTALTDTLMYRRALPPHARNAAIHIAVAAVHDIPYLLTWRVRRLAYPGNIQRFRKLCEQQGYRGPVLCNPYEIRRDFMPDDILEEVWAIREKMSEEYYADPEGYRARERARKYPGFTYATPGRTSKAEEDQD